MTLSALAAVPAMLATASGQPQPRFGATAVAVVVDATVRDAAGKHLPCLDASQFQLLEDGQPQRISSFEAIDVPGCGAPKPDASSSATPPPLTRVLTTAPLFTALVFEELGDRARLDAWRAAKRVRARGPAAGRVRRGVRHRPGGAHDGPVHQGHGRRCRRASQGSDAAGLSDRVARRRGQRGVFKPVPERHVRRCAGRRDVERIAGRGRDAGAPAGPEEHRAVLRRLPGAARRQRAGHLPAPHGRRQPEHRDLSHDRRGRSAHRPAERARPRSTTYLEQLARDTGGQYVSGTNDLTAAVRKVTADIRDYYRLTYSPTNPALDGGYRRLAVKVRVPGAVVTSRNGYQATPRPANAVVAPIDVAPHVLLDAETLPRDFALDCETTLTSSAVTITATVSGAVLAFQSDAATGAFEGGLTVLARVRGKDQHVLAASSDTFTLSGRQDQLPAAKGRVLRFNRQLATAGAVTLEVIAYDVLGQRASAQRFKMKDLRRR